MKKKTEKILTCALALCLLLACRRRPDQLRQPDRKRQPERQQQSDRQRQPDRKWKGSALLRQLVEGLHRP